MVSAVKGMRVGPVDGTMCAIIKTTEGEVAIPAHGLVAVLQELHRRMSAADAQQNAVTAQGWARVNIIPAQTMNVDLMPTTDTQRVVLTLDRGRPSEVSYSLSSENATELAEQLSSAAQMIAGAPPAPMN